MSTEVRLPIIHTIREEPVVLDSDLAHLYGVDTGALNRAIKRQSARFPSDFAFQMSPEEWETLRCQIGISSFRGGRRYRPWVFGEHGAIMAAMILNSGRAVAMGIYVVRAFVRMRRELLVDAVFKARLERIEKTLLSHDAALRDVFQKLLPLLAPAPAPGLKEIGFHTRPKKP